MSDKDWSYRDNRVVRRFSVMSIYKQFEVEMVVILCIINVLNGTTLIPLS